MADYYASIFGTEKDKNSAKAQGDGKEISDEECQRHFDEFFEDIYIELEEKYGPIEEMNVCDNLGDHLIGNVYVKFKYEEDAEKAVDDLNNRWFDGKPVYAELSTVTTFSDAGCRQYEIGTCKRGGFCNFMHLKQISSSLKRDLFGSSRGSRRSKHHSHRSHISKSRSRSRSRTRSRSRSSSDSRTRHRTHHRSSRKSHHYRSKSRTRSRSISPRPVRSRTRSESQSPSHSSRSRRSHKSSSSRRHRHR